MKISGQEALKIAQSGHTDWNFPYEVMDYSLPLRSIARLSRPSSLYNQYFT